MSFVPLLITLLLAWQCDNSEGNTLPSSCASGKTCLNDGKCEAVAGSEYCHCDPDYSQDLCDVRTPRQPLQLVTCLDGVSSPEECESAIDSTSDDEPNVDSSFEVAAPGVTIYTFFTRTDVLGFKLMQSHIKTLEVTFSNGVSLLVAMRPCDQSSEYWDVVTFPAPLLDIHLMSVTIDETCDVNVPAYLTDIFVIKPYDECTEDPDLCNVGVCDELPYGYNCDCTGTGFMGAHCEINIDDCAVNLCVFGDCEDEINGYSCTCDTGYTGTNCDIKSCTTDPCENQGRCLEGQNATHCVCPVRYKGNICENDRTCTDIKPTERQNCGKKKIKRNACMDKDCCYDRSVKKSPWCFQPEGIGDPCSFLKCENGATCNKISATDAECLCPTGWYGRICEKRDAAQPTCTVTNKVNCGFSGIDEIQCKIRGCCFKKSSKKGQPWCYYSHSVE